MGKELSNIGQKGVEVAVAPGIAFGFKGMGAATSELSEVEFDRTMDEMWIGVPKQRGALTFLRRERCLHDPWVICRVLQKPLGFIVIEDKMNKVLNNEKILERF